jgi:hypothetical protein
MGTQTSKPLHGDEERRNRFRRPRTPVNGPPSRTDGDKTWPCANCHATVSNQESRCPYCGGIQVKIPHSPPSDIRVMNSNLLLERLAATPTTPVTRKEIDASRIRAFLSESATTSTMDYDEDDDDVEDLDEDDVKGLQERPTSALSQSSSISQNFNLPRPTRRLPSPFVVAANSPAPSVDSVPAGIAATPSVSSPFQNRPPDPVALTLEAALRSGTPSPQIMYEKQEGTVVSKRKAASGFEAPKKKQVLPS